MSCLLSCFIVPDFDDVTKSTEAYLAKIKITLQSLLSLNPAQNIDLRQYVVLPPLEYDQALLDSLKEVFSSSSALYGEILGLKDKDNFKMLQSCLGKVQDGYVWFLPAGSNCNRELLEQVEPYLLKGENGVKLSITCKSDLMYARDSLYEYNIEKAPQSLVKGFSSLIFSVKFFSKYEYFEALKRYPVTTDVTCSVAVIDALLQHGVNLDTSTGFGKYLRYDQEQLSQAKNMVPFIYLPLAKVYVPVPSYLSKEQVQELVKQTFLFLNACQYPDEQKLALVLINFLDQVPYCANSELKNQLCLNTNKLYQVALSVLFKRGEKMQKAREKMDMYINYSAASNPLAQAIKDNDVLAMVEQVTQRKFYSIVLRASELYNDRGGLQIIKQRLQEFLKRVQSDLSAENTADATVTTKATTATTVSADNVYSTTAANTTSPTASAESQEETGKVYPDIYVVSVVNNQPLYAKLFTNNACVNGYNFHLCPILNPDPKEPERVFGLPEAYNKFLDSFDFAKPGWIVFCHNDLEFEDDLSGKLANLDPNKIYGIGGSYTVQINNRYVPIFLGTYYKQYPSRDFAFTCRFDASIEGYPAYLERYRDKYTVDSLDCLCIIMHSSLIAKYNLRFDENLRFDLVAEDMCMNAWYNHQIPSKIVDLMAIHYSNANPMLLPPSYYASLQYINKKYPKALIAGSGSMIGGGVPRDQYFLQN